MPISSNPKTSPAVAMILSDIPLLCEGIMGIGIFTFLFIVKQVGCLTCFLYGSSFLTFVAATLDLSQAVTRDQLIVVDGSNLGSICGLINARDVLLAFAGLSLNLYIWKLVSQCSRCEREDNGMATKIRRQSWHRLGIPGRILKWASLTALLTAPLLQMVWKLVPSQHRYSPVYVATSVIETTLASAFILKLVLNAYISPSNSWWQEFRSGIAPITALVIGVSLGIGNLVLFALTETSQGRLLHAVEVYLLFLHNLCTTFPDVVNSSRGSTRQVYEPPSIRETEKKPIQLVTPFPYNHGGAGDEQPKRILEVARKYGGPPLPAMSYTWASQTNTSAALFKQRNRLQTQTPPSLTRTAFPLAENSRSVTTTPILKEEQPLSNIVPQLQDPPMPMTLPLDRESLQVVTEVRAESPDQFDVLAYTGFGQEEQENDAQSRQSVIALDEIIRQQNELDERIAALQAELSVAPSPLHAEPSEFLQAPSNSARSTLMNSVMTTPTEGTSNNSVFSLSIFPEPPVSMMNENSDRDNIVNRPAPSRSRRKKKRFNDTQTSTSRASPRRSISSQNRFNSTGTQWDVTSFIGNLTLSQPPGTPRTPSPDSVMEETRGHSTVNGSHNVALRPLILDSGHRLSFSQSKRLGARAAGDLPFLLSPASSNSGELSASYGSKSS